MTATGINFNFLFDKHEKRPRKSEAAFRLKMQFLLKLNFILFHLYLLANEVVADAENCYV